jgi:cytochrome P450
VSKRGAVEVREEAGTEAYDPYVHTSADNVYEIYADLRENSPVYFCVARDAWCLTRHDDIQRAARDWKTFSNLPGVALDAPNLYGRGDFLDDDPPRHDALRNVVRPFFTPKAIAGLADDIRRRTAEILAELRESSRADLAEEFAVRLPIWVISRLIGAPEVDDEDIQRIVLAMERRDVGEPEIPESATSAVREMHAYLDDLASHKRRHPGDDVLSHITAAAESGTLDANEIAGMGAILFSAGSETTYSLLGNLLAQLSDHPDALESLRRRPIPELVDATIEESLRYEAPVQYLARTATVASEWHGVKIPEGARALLVWAAGSRDPTRWERPEEFDIYRTDKKRHLAFGEGIHFCLGAPLARLEARVALPMFLSTFSEYRIRSGRRRPHHIVRGWEELDADLIPNRGL